MQIMGHLLSYACFSVIGNIRCSDDDVTKAKKQQPFEDCVKNDLEIFKKYLEVFCH